MNKKSHYILMLFVFVAMLGNNGCKQQCNIPCARISICKGDSCDCGLYFEGVGCQTATINKFAGTFNGNLYAGNSATPKSVSFSITIDSISVTYGTIASPTEPIMRMTLKGHDSVSIGPTFWADSPYDISATATGTGIITANGKNLTLRYSFGTDTNYVYTGIKQ